MATDLRRGWLLACLACACGCASPRGFLFTQVVEPYALPVEADRRAGSKQCSIDLTEIKEPLSQLSLSVLWTNRAVAEAMQRAQMTEVRYADLYTLSFFNDVYARRRLIFYGD